MIIAFVYFICFDNGIFLRTVLSEILNSALLFTGTGFCTKFEIKHVSKFSTEQHHGYMIV